MGSPMELRHVPAVGGLASPSAWDRSTALDRRADWHVELSDADRRELRETTRQACHLPPHELTAQTFPLAGLADRLRVVWNTLREGVGFTRIRALPVDGLSIPEQKTMLFGVGAHLGRCVVQGQPDRYMVDVQKVDEPDRHIFAFETDAALPFHSDQAELTGLLCLTPAAAGGVSRLVSSQHLFSTLQQEDARLAAALFEPVDISNRDVNFSGATHASLVEGCFSLHKRAQWRAPAAKAGHRANYQRGAESIGDDELRRALGALDRLASIESNQVTMQLEPGDLQLVNNHVIMHGRDSFANSLDRNRHLLRLWLDAEFERPVAETYARWFVWKTTR